MSEEVIKVSILQEDINKALKAATDVSTYNHICDCHIGQALQRHFQVTREQVVVSCGNVSVNAKSFIMDEVAYRIALMSVGSSEWQNLKPTQIGIIQW